MKKLIVVTVMALCLALCAAVWPQGKTVGKTTPSDIRNCNERPGNARCNA